MAPPTSDAAADPVAHHVGPRSRWAWLPTALARTLAAHPVCEDCGTVKMIGAERGREMGGLMNLLAGLERKLRYAGYKSTEAQRRLIARRLEAEGVGDSFGLSRAAQDRILAQIVGDQLRIAPWVVESYLRTC